MPFSYNDPTAKQVWIIGSFTEWKPEPMKPGNAGAWTFRKKLAFGKSYDYRFSVDGKNVPDPKRPRTKLDDKGVELSSLTVSIPDYPKDDDPHPTLKVVSQ